MSHEIHEEISSLSSAVQLTNVFRGIQIKLDFFVYRFFPFLSLFLDFHRLQGAPKMK